MRTRTGTGLVIALFLAFSLLCSVSLVAQDKLLVTSTNNKVADSASVNCSAYAADGVTCIAGQYYHSDNALPSATWNPLATSTAFGGWAEAASGYATNGCLSCHHGSVSTSGRGGGYLIGGHKNILRKVVAGQTLLDTQGNALTTVSDHNNSSLFYTLNQAAGTMTNQTGTANTVPALYVLGWYTGSNTNGYDQGMTYGSCARCHTTGYRPDGNAPEPTAVTGTAPASFTFTKLTDAQFGRIPVGSAAPATSSWSLTGIQCERCHKADMQYDATVINPNYNAGTSSSPNWQPTNGRISHLVSIQAPANIDSKGNIPGTDFFVGTAVVGTSTRPLPKAPSALTCIECHQAYSTWTNKTAGQVGQVHLTPLPGFESLATPIDTTKFTSTKLATGQYSATWGCSVAGVKTNDYNGCIAAGGTVTYVPGGMSHGAVATILNSPHARVTGYVDVRNPGTADNTLTIKGGTVNGVPVVGKYNSFFSSTGPDTNNAPAGFGGGVTGSCAGCHNIHGDLTQYAGFSGSNLPVNATNVENTLTSCTTCHASHGKAMNHPTGPGTPFAAVNGSAGGFGSQESCSTCHLSKKSGTKYHFLRINPDPNYNTFPSAQQYYTTVGSGQYGKLNTYNSGETYTDGNGVSQPYPAVGLDVDIACGQCHTGGDGTKNPYGITPYAGDGGVQPRPYSRAFLANAALSMHNTAAARPTFNPALPANGGPTTITITTSDVSEGSYASIFYTTDGTIPTVTVNAYEQYVGGGTTKVAAGPSVSIPVTATTTIYALAAGPASYSFTPSAVVGGTYGVQVTPKPSISPSNGNLVAPATMNVTITDSLSSAVIYYTTDGTTPTASSTKYTGAITVSTPEVINAIAIAPGYGSSLVATGTFTVTAPAPAFSLNGGLAKYPGTYTGAVQANLTDIAPSLCYTLNGATPVVTAGVCTTGTSVASGTNIAINASATIKAVAFGPGYSTSKVTSGNYAIH